MDLDKFEWKDFNFFFKEFGNKISRFENEFCKKL